MNADLLSQINPATFSIDPNWVIIIMGSVVSFLMIRTLTKMEKMLEQHEKDIEELKTSHAVHNQKIDNMESQYPSKVAELILSKLKSMNG